MSRSRSSSFVLVALAVAALASACSNSSSTAAAAPERAANTVQLAPENVATVSTARLTTGPVVSGQLSPSRDATVRAQVGGSIVSLPFDRGQTVRAGAVVAKISSRDLEDSMASAQVAVRSAESALNLATSERQRTESLVKGGALAARDLEQAANAVSAAEAQVAAAKARQKSVWQQIDDTSVKAPFDGVVSDRPASLGDVVSSGTPLVTIIDPSSMRLEALVPASDLQQVRPGSKVRFTIRGVGDQSFMGTVERLSPNADPVTRQVSIFVSLPNIGGKLLAGLFAEGRVEAATREGLVVPLAALDETGPTAFVTRIRDGKAERVNVTPGLRQADTEIVEITQGLAAGDVVIVGSAKTVAVGTPVNVVRK